MPQGLHLFRGTLRFNLDPWAEHSDDALRATLKMLGLATELDASISENGDNLSAGQRQLLCVCRALLVSRRIICVEATARWTKKRAGVIQNVPRTAPQFRRATLIVIAHRIKTIVDSDQILVLDRGRLMKGRRAVRADRRNGPSRRWCARRGRGRRRVSLPLQIRRLGLWLSV